MRRNSRKDLNGRLRDGENEGMRITKGWEAK